MAPSINKGASPEVQQSPTTPNTDSKNAELFQVQSLSLADDDEDDEQKLKFSISGVSNGEEDDAVAFLLANDHLEPLSELEEKRAIRRTDWILLPCLFFTATMGAVDKVSLGTAAIFGLVEDNGLVGQQYSWLGSILFIGSLVGMWPMTFLVQKYRSGKVIAMASLFWSLITLIQCSCKNFAGLVALRFLMGVAECVIVPGCSLLISVFYLKHESPHRTALVFAFASSVINGALSSLASTFGDGISTWKYIFLLVGSISFVWSCFMIYFLPDSPINAKFLTQREKVFMVRRVVLHSTGVSNNAWKWNQVFEGFTDIRTYIVMLFNFGINVPNGGLSTFSSIIMRNLGFTSVQSSLMGIPTGVIASLASFGFTWVGSRWINRRCLLALISLIVPLIGAIVCYSCLQTNIAAQLLGLYMMYFYFASYVMMISCVQANTAGNTKKPVTYGLNYLGYCGGAITGTQTFRASQAPRYTGGFISMLVGYAACMALALSYWIVCIFLNRSKRQALALEGGDDYEDGDFEDEKMMDLTDKQQRHFFYTT